MNNNRYCGEMKRREMEASANKLAEGFKKAMMGKRISEERLKVLVEAKKNRNDNYDSKYFPTELEKILDEVVTGLEEERKHTRQLEDLWEKRKNWILDLID